MDTSPRRIKCVLAAPFAALVIYFLIAGSMAGPAWSASQISGKLSKRGYTVLAISTSGKTVASKAKKGSFKLRAPGKAVTLQLLDARGRYAGPIVVGKKGSRAVVGVKAGAKLGKVRVARGYAKPVKKLDPRFVVRSRTAKASKGVPIGARGYGLVRSAGASRVQGRAADAPNTARAGADTDGDGVPNALDIDANGNSAIDAVDPSAPKPAGFGVFSQLFLDLNESVNADASGVTTAQIDQAMVNHLTLVFTSVPADTQLDCNGLTYCSEGGTGQVSKPPEEGGDGGPFPSCCDGDGNGFGTISGGSQGPTGSEFRLSPRATSSSIHSGDTMTELVGSNTYVPGSLGFVFNTVPAVKQLTDGAGTTTAFSYPVPPGAPGTKANPISIPSSAASALTLTFWRPQRQPILGAGEGPGLIDIGQLDYQIQLPNAPGAPPTPGSHAAPQCPQSSFSTSDRNLSIGGGAFGGATDKGADTPADPSQTVTFTLNLADCVKAHGGSLAPSGPFNISLSAVSRSPTSVDHADQVIYFRLV